MRLSTLPVSTTRLPLWPPVLATRGPGGASAGHAHHAMHLVLATAGDLRVRVGNGRWRSAPGVLTAPDVTHAIDAAGREVLLVFLDPESEAGAALRSALAAPVLLVDDTARRELAAGDPMALMRGGGADWTRRVVELLAGQALAPRPATHPRVRRLLARLRTLGPEDETSLEALAAAVGLSPGRLMHAFTESIGTPLRPYLTWLKLQRAAAGIVGGMPLADAAHAAGFADSAHMSRTFRRMFGMTPSMLRPSQLLQDPGARRR